MNIMITGANGFVGSNLAKELGKRHYIIGVGQKNGPLTQVDEYIKWNIQEDFPKKQYNRKIDVIIHAAASLNQNDMSSQLVPTNCMGAYQVFRLSLEKKVFKVVYISSIPVIGNPLEHPISEHHPLNPLTMYHATKLSAEYLLYQLAKYGTEVIILRIPSPIAPDMPEKTILPIFASRAFHGEIIEIYGKGSRRQNYLDVRDLAGVIEKNLAGCNITGVYNIASERTVSNKELAQLCINIAGSSSEIRIIDRPDPLDGQVWDITCLKAKEQLGYYQRYPIEESIKDIMNYRKGS